MNSMGIKVLLLSLLLSTMVVYGNWVQPRFDSHQSNFQKVKSSGNTGWNFETTGSRGFNNINSVIVDQDVLTIVATGWGFCYAPNYFFVDTRTGKLNSQSFWNCNIDKSNAISLSNGDIFSYVNEDFPEHAFLINQKGFVKGANQTDEYVYNIADLGGSKILLNIREGRWKFGGWKLVGLDTSTNTVLYTIHNKTLGYTIVDDNNKIYAISSNQDSIMVFDGETGELSAQVYSYSTLQYSEILVPNKGKKHDIYLIERTQDSSRVTSWIIGEKGTSWVTRPFDNDATMVLDNTGEYIVVYDGRYQYVSIIATKDGIEVTTIPRIQYDSQIISVTDKNEFVLGHGNKLDFYSIPDAKLVKSLTVFLPASRKNLKKCVLDSGAAYCCGNTVVNMYCSKTLLD